MHKIVNVSSIFHSGLFILFFLVDRQIDVNKDNMLNRLEFNNGAYHIYKTYREYETGGTNIPKPFQAFVQLDLDGDE